MEDDDYKHLQFWLYNPSSPPSQIFKKMKGFCKVWNMGLFSL